jgi:hypothetical protein
MATVPAETVCLLRPAPAEWVSDAEHDEFGDGDALDEQKGAIGAEDAQRALDLAPPLNRQYAGDCFDDPKVFVRSCCEEGGVPPPSPDDNQKSADQCSALESAVAGRSPHERYVSVHEG